MRALISIVCGVCLLGFAGCFETKFSLGSQADSKVDVNLCGRWEITDANAQPGDAKIQMAVCNLDGKSYFVQWTNPNEKEEKDRVMSMVAWTARVKDANFAQVRGLVSDGTIDEKHLLVRFDLKGNTLTLRHLNDKFFKDQPINSDADLRKIIEDNLNDADMYDETDVTATRMEK